MSAVEKNRKETRRPEPEKPPDDFEYPDWYDGKKIDEAAFSEHMMKRHPMKCVNGILYDIGGLTNEKRLEKDIYDIITAHVHTNLQKTVSKLIEAIKIRAYCDSLPAQTDRIHVGNGTLFLNGEFDSSMQFCANRLPVRYNPNAPKPEIWFRFLSELLEPDDVPTLQEFMGYVLIPTNRAQTMMLIIGNGGEGKSRIGRVMRAILGDNMNTCSIQKLATDRFSRADQEGKLLMLDDDMKMEALQETNVLKAVVTMEDKIDLERKGRQSTQGYLYVRILGFGNGSLSALYDRSEGFYRRQLVLVVKDKDTNRVDDRQLGDKLMAEAEGIFLWCLEGLKRLISQDYHFTVSEGARRRMEEARKEDNNILDFLESTGYIRFEKNTTATSRALYNAYVTWCCDNAERPFSEKTFSSHLKRNAGKLGIVYDKNISLEYGKTARGYRGVHVLIRSDGCIQMRIA